MALIAADKTRCKCAVVHTVLAAELCLIRALGAVHIVALAAVDDAAATTGEDTSNTAVLLTPVAAVAGWTGLFLLLDALALCIQRLLFTLCLKAALLVLGKRAALLVLSCLLISLIIFLLFFLLLLLRRSLLERAAAGWAELARIAVLTETLVTVVLLAAITEAHACFATKFTLVAALVTLVTGGIETLLAASNLVETGLA
jgi:hypothetical protein